MLAALLSIVNLHRHGVILCGLLDGFDPNELQTGFLMRARLIKCITQLLLFTTIITVLACSLRYPEDLTEPVWIFGCDNKTLSVLTLVFTAA